MADQDQTTQASNFLQTNQEAPAQVTADDLVGEGKKFENVDALANGKEYADRHITNLEQEAQRMRDRIESLESQGNLVEELKAEMSKTPEPVVPAEANPPSSEPQVTNEMDLQALIDQRINADKQEAAATANIAAVTNAMVEKYGENWDAEARRVGAENDLSLEDVNAMVATKPKLFLKLAGLDGVTPVVNQPSGVNGTVNTEAMVTANANKPKDKAYYKALQKEMGDTKFFGDARIQNEILENGAF
jgi:hypothetical protein